MHSYHIMATAYMSCVHESTDQDSSKFSRIYMSPRTRFIARVAEGEHAVALGKYSAMQWLWLLGVG